MDNLEESLWYRSESQQQDFLDNVVEYVGNLGGEEYKCLYDIIDKIYINKIEC